MTSRILKWPLNSITDLVTGEILHVGVDDLSQICVWAWHHGAIPRRFEVFATGEHIEQGTPGRYLGTAIKPNGTVWHVFETAQWGCTTCGGHIVNDPPCCKTENGGSHTSGGGVYASD